MARMLELSGWEIKTTIIKKLMALKNKGDSIQVLMGSASREMEI